MNDDIWKVNEQLTDIKKKYLKKLSDLKARKPNNGEKWSTKNIDANTHIQEEKPLKINLINLTFIGPIIGIERKIREMMKEATQNGELPIPRRLKKNCYLLNKIALSRFLSSNASTCYSACKAYSSKE